MAFDLREVSPPAKQAVAPYSWPERRVFEDRIERLLGRMHDEQLDILFVYGDREHCGNLAYLCQYDPRFEEALLILLRDGQRYLLVGNEGAVYAGICPIDIEVILYQSFSLLGQARDSSPPLKQVLRRIGISAGQRAGMIGWKYFTAEEFGAPQTAIEVPSFLVDEVRSILGTEAVVNATALLMHPGHGLRVFLEAEQIIAFEAAAQRASHGVMDALARIAPGRSEAEIAQGFGYDGRPLNYHPVVLSGERTSLGLASPSSKAIEAGDPLFVAIGGWGANSVRAGIVADSPRRLAAARPGYVDRVVAPFMEMMAAWYETVAVGAAAADTVAAVDAALGGDIERIALNPGHHIHIDEWVSSPFVSASDIVLASGMMLQMDIIPIVAEGGFGTNAEDGVALADATMRDALQRADPAFWDRVQNRRRYMREAIGITVDESLLPMSDVQGWLTPALLDPTHAMARS